MEYPKEFIKDDEVQNFVIKITKSTTISTSLAETYLGFPFPEGKVLVAYNDHFTKKEFRCIGNVAFSNGIYLELSQFLPVEIKHSISGEGILYEAIRVLNEEEAEQLIQLNAEMYI